MGAGPRLKGLRLSIFPRRPLRSASTRGRRARPRARGARTKSSQTQAKLAARSQPASQSIDLNFSASNFKRQGEDEALYGIDRPMVKKFKAMRPPSKWIHIFGKDQTVAGR